METQYELVAFTLCVTLSAGIFGVGGVLAALKKGTEIQFIAPLIALIIAAIGGVASFTHLQRWERAFNGFGHLSSGITQEMIAMVVFCLIAVVYAILAKTNRLPSWAGWVAAFVSVALVVVMAHSYNVASRPAWDTPLLWLYYLSNAMLFGSLVCALLLEVKKSEDAQLAIKASFVGGALTAVAALAYCLFFSSAAGSFASIEFYFDPTEPTKAINDPASAFAQFATGPESLLFWVGVVVVGALVPMVASFLLNKQKGGAFIGIVSGGVLCGLVGGLCFRYILYALSYSVFVLYG
ncbi:MAG: dimethyl sulfoxide reductase anchor subunit [Coriobacteriaceae bacterium]|jgi:DMSO reductase anchor subunit|nr:dimethyl sulfoxide reductase anchor subunit [Coriobacteriaceae bacterium]